MKNKLSRVLVLLLAIAMMIPSFAMADGAVTITTTAVSAMTVALEGGVTQYQVLDKDGQPATYTFEDTTGENYSMHWKSSDETIVKVVADTPATGTHTVPTLSIYKVGGPVTITGYATNEFGQESAAKVSFTVTATEVKIAEFKLASATGKVNLSEGVFTLPTPSVTKTDPEGKTATYAYSWNWSITSGAEFADMRKDTASLALKKAGKVVLSVSPKGTSTAAAQTFTLEIFDSQEEDPDKVGYESLKFETKTFEIEEPTISLNQYLTKVKPANWTDLTVNWESNDESIATVDDSGNVTFSKEGTVTITATSAANKAATDTATVTYKKPAENNYATVKFDKSSATVNNDWKDYDDEEEVPVGEYTVKVNTTLMDETKEKFPGESVVFYVDEPQIVTFTGNGRYVDFEDDDFDWGRGWITSDNYCTVQWDWTLIKKDTTVTIWARSYRNPECKPDSFKLTIKAAEKELKSITVLETPITLRWSNLRDVDLTQYVTTDPVGFEYDLAFTSGNPEFVKTYGVHAYVDESCVPGEATITVRAPEYPEVEAKTFKVKYEKEGIQKLSFVNLPETIKTDLYLGDYLNIEPYYYGMEDLYWDTTDPQVATVADGYLDIQKSGTVTIKVCTVDGSVSAKADIKVEKKSKVTNIALKDVTMKVNDELDLIEWNLDGSVVMGESNFTILPFDAEVDIDNLYFTSSNREVAEVQLFDRDAQGYYLVAYKPGTTTITATYKDEDATFTATCKVTVTEVALTGIVLPEQKVTLKLYSEINGAMRFNLDPVDASIDLDDLYAESGDKAVVDGVSINVGEGKGTVYFTAKAPGKAWISIKRTSDGETLAAFKVVVETTKVKRISLPKKTIHLNWYDDGLTVKSNRTYQNSYWLKTTVSPASAYYTISYKTTDPSVAFVRDQMSLDPSDLSSRNMAEIVAAGVGTATITVSVDDGYKVRTAKLKVVVDGKAPKLAIDQKKATIDMTAGEKTIKLNAFNAETEDKVAVTWTSSNPKVAKVNKNGKVTALAEGKTTITATHEASGQKVTCKVTVKSDTKVVTVKKISGDKYVTIKKGEKQTLNIKVKPAGAEVTYSSSDEKIVTVDKNGKIKGKKAGKATITVKGDGVTFKVKVTVK